MLPVNNNSPLTGYEEKLLNGWEEVYKKGQLTLWIMLALKHGPKYMAQIKLYISEATKNTLTADDQSMYRALRRYYDADLVGFTAQPGDSGPDRKLYNLSPVGIHVLQKFLDRNIIGVFYDPTNRNLIGLKEI